MIVPLQRIALGAAGTITAAACTAQDLLPKAPPEQRPVLIRSAVLHTMDRGTIIGGTLVFDNGVITGIYAEDAVPRPEFARKPLIIDGVGKHVFPGMIAVNSQLGLQEIGSVRQTVDVDELGDMSPEALAVVAVNPDSTALPVARSNGVLTAAVFPSGGLIPGRASIIVLDGWTNRDMTVRADAGLVINWPSAASTRRFRGRPSRGSNDDEADSAERARQRIDEEFTHARAWLDARQADPNTAPDLRAQSMVPSLLGKTPVFLLANDLEQIESAVGWATSRGLRAVIVGGRDADLCASLLDDHDIPVVLAGVHRLPRRNDSPYDEPFTLPARLQALGVRFCIATGGSYSNERNLPYHAATAAAFGLGRKRAMAAITSDAAEILGVADRIGSLTVGKDATMVMADGNPLDLTTKIEQAFVRGRSIDLRNKHTELARKYRAKYRQLQGDK